MFMFSAVGLPFFNVDSLPLSHHSRAQAIYVEEMSKAPRDSKDVISDDPGFISMKDSLRKAAALAVSRMSG